MPTIEDIKAVHADPAATLPALTAAADAARALVNASEADVAALNAHRPSVLLTGTDKELARLDDGIAVASRMAERATAFATALDARAADLRIAAEERGRRERYEAARIAVADLALTMPEKYRRLVELAHEILSDIVKARGLQQAANRALPDGAAPLPDPEAFRNVVSRPTIAAKEAMTLWCLKDGTPLPLNRQGEVLRLDNGEGMIPTTSYSSADETRYVRGACWRVTVQPAAPFVSIGAFDARLAIPPLFAGGARGWYYNENFPTSITARLAEFRDHQQPCAPATVEEIIPADGFDALKRRHGIA